MSLCRRGRIWHYDFWHHGQRFRGSTEQTGLSTARKVEALLMLRAREHRALIKSNRIPILSEFATRFLQWVKTSNLEPNTKRYYEYGWRMLKQTEIAGMRLDQVTTDTAEVLRFPKSAANGNVALRTLRRMLKKAVEWDVIQFYQRIKLLKEHGREILIDPQTEAKLLAAANQPLRDVIVIMQDTGMRPQDVFRMRWEHVNWFKQVIFIPYGKTKHSRRYVPLSDRIERAFELRERVLPDGYSRPDIPRADTSRTWRSSGLQPAKLRA